MTLCDFCSGLPVTAAYPCRDFTVPGTPCGSRGAWAACQACAQLIDADQREALARRAWVHADRNLLFGRTGPLPIPEEEGVRFMRELHHLFFAHRCGDAVPVGLN
ncbi:MAG: hypothetical protein KatS3mg082_2614 [Nitrospiraceae bacterium]|nr:MAG: hypothetical protein KatS3mg082_2614 [Nitrospiraceae bacterium]